MRNSLNRWIPIATVAALLAGPALADTDFGGRAGAYTDETRAFVGAELLMPVDTNSSWYANPNFEYAFADDATDLATLNGDFHYDFDTQGKYAAWIGAGPALLFEDGPGDSETDFGANLLAGFGAKRGSARPYFQGKVVVADDPQLVFGLGVRF
jgi:hypothetical protein